MSQPNKAFCTFAEWHCHLPDELKSLTEADWLARSREGRFPPYFRLISQKNPAYFRKSDLAAYWRLKFGVLRPDCVQAILDAGFEEYAPAPGYPMNRRYKAKVGLKNSQVAELKNMESDHDS